MNTRDEIVRNWRTTFWIWLVLLTVATHFPQSPPSDNPVFESPDKMLHFICFGMLAFIFVQTRFVRCLWQCWVILALWAGVDELTQHYLSLNREFSAADLLSGELGISAFILWSGALSGGSVSNIRESVESTLLKIKNWFSIACIGIGVGIGAMVLFWFLIKTITGKQYSSVAFLDSFLITTGCILWFFVRKGGLQLIASRIIKSMLPSILVTIVIAVMIGVITSFTPINPWVAALAMLVGGLRFAWNKAI